MSQGRPEPYDALLRHPVLAPEEVRALAVLACQGDLAAAHRLLLHHQKFARLLAVRYAGRRLSPEDAIQAANLGLLYALRRFEPERGVPFHNYAAAWIRSFAQRARNGDYLIPVSDHLCHGPRRVLPPLVLSLDSCNDGHGRNSRDQRNLRETLPDPRAEEHALREEDRAHADQLLHRAFPGRDRRRLVLELRFGLRDGVEWTLEEVGHRLGVSRERARQIEQQALGYLVRRGKTVPRNRPGRKPKTRPPKNKRTLT